MPRSLRKHAVFECAGTVNLSILPVCRVSVPKKKKSPSGPQSLAGIRCFRVSSAAPDHLKLSGKHTPGERRHCRNLSIAKGCNAVHCGGHPIRSSTSKTVGHKSSFLNI